MMNPRDVAGNAEEKEADLIEKKKKKEKRKKKKRKKTMTKFIVCSLKIIEAVL